MPPKKTGIAVATEDIQKIIADARDLYPKLQTME